MITIRGENKYFYTIETKTYVYTINIKHMYVVLCIYRRRKPVEIKRKSKTFYEIFKFPNKYYNSMCFSVEQPVLSSRDGDTKII